MTVWNCFETLNAPNKFFGGKWTSILSKSSVVSKTALREASVVMLRVKRREVMGVVSDATLRFCSGRSVNVRGAVAYQSRTDLWCSHIISFGGA
jgi:hypothetical protein